MRKTTGLTLIELLVVIGLVVVLATVAVPAYYHMVAHNRVTAAINALAATLSMARSEAITRGEPVIVCPSEDVTATPPQCDSSGGWQEGWFVFADKDDNFGGEGGNHQFGTNDELIRVHGPVGGGVTTTDSGENFYIAFNRMGFAQPTFEGSTDTSLSVIACPPDKRAAKARALVLSLSGDVTTAARKPDGSTFSCS